MLWFPPKGIDAINQSKVVELLKDGGGERRHSREGVNSPGGPRGDSEGDDSADWNGVCSKTLPCTIVSVARYRSQVWCSSVPSVEQSGEERENPADTPCR